jgi:membrane fusion protein (multidrug efflux system)
MNTAGIKKGLSIVLILAAGWFLHAKFGMMFGGMPPMPGPGQMPPATVTSSVIAEQSLQPASEYIASIEAVEDVLIQSEVSGRIESVHFTEGSLVKAGDLLFTIDRAKYQAAADAAAADLARAQKLYDRMKNADERSFSKSDMDTAESTLLQAKAALDLAQVSLNYTEIKAPVSGRIGAANLTKGNYVTAASGPLARIVQIDPVRVTFSLTDREYLKLQRVKLAGSGSTRTAQVRLADGTLLPNPGKKEFDDNAINPQTGTMAVRYLFSNPDGLLIPGGYVTALLQNPEGEQGIKIPQKALLVDQQGSYVLTVDASGTVGILRVQPGDQLGADVIILSGLKPGDRIIIDGVQKARPGATVQVMEK